MKKLPFVLIPAIVVIVLVVVILLFRMVSSSPLSAPPAQLPDSISVEQTQQPVDSSGAAAQDSASALSEELKGTIDDGGKADLDALTEEASGL
jgi:flagellar basal body-associated protein FliL